MAVSDTRKSVIEIINTMEERLSVRKSVTLTDRKMTGVLLNFLNDVIDETSDFGDWQEMYREIELTAAAGQRVFKIETSAEIKNIYEIHWNDNVAPLEHRSIETIRRLRRTGSKGTPRQFAVLGVSGASPLVEVFPAVSTVQSSGGGNTFNVALYKKPRLFRAVTADVSAVPAFPYHVLEQGLYAKTLAEEEGGGQTQKYQVAYLEYQRVMKESLNRFNADTGTDIYLAPTGKYGGRN